MSKIFLSHSHSDKPFTRKLAADLRAYGHTVWIDEAEIKIGDSLISKIRDGIDEVDYVAAILSKSSIESQWVEKELEIASNRELEEKKVIVLPVLIDDVKLPGFLKGKFYGDFRNEKEYDDKLQLLLKSVGDNVSISKNLDELEILKKELAETKQLVKQHVTVIEKLTEHSIKSKSKTLQDSILRENKSHPEYAPINNVYAFELGDVAVTIGYLLHCLRKSKMKGGHSIEWLLDTYDKWNEVDRMFEAYQEMLDSMGRKTQQT